MNLYAFDGAKVRDSFFVMAEDKQTAIDSIKEAKPELADYDQWLDFYIVRTVDAGEVIIVEACEDD